jgi:hypothetical protein
VASASVSSVPVSVEMIGIAGADSFTRRTSASNGVTAASIMAEWNACEVCNRRTATPSASSVARSASIASNGPAATDAPGALSAASDTPAGNRASSSLAGSRTDSIAPAGSACISAPRRATRRAASASGITPATTAAANSPTLWPIIAAGVAPRASHDWANATSTQNVAGCVTAVSRNASALPLNTRCARSNSSPQAATASSNAARNTGSWACRARPMPAYCAPWPGNSHTSGGRIAPTIRCARIVSSAARSARTASSTDFALTHKRCAKRLRPCCSVCATSAKFSAGWACSASASDAAIAASAVGVRADNISSCGPIAADDDSRTGASSSTACALVPPTPKLLTPARRG